MQLNKFGFSNEAIARYICVDGRTVAKALRWMQDNSQKGKSE